MWVWKLCTKEFGSNVGAKAHGGVGGAHKVVVGEGGEEEPDVGLFISEAKDESHGVSLR